MFVGELKKEDVKVGIKVFGTACGKFGTIETVSRHEDEVYVQIRWENGRLGLRRNQSYFHPTLIIDDFFFISVKK